MSITQPTDKLLEQSPWSALTTTHSVFALGNDLAGGFHQRSPRWLGFAGFPTTPWRL